MNSALTEQQLQPFFFCRRCYQPMMYPKGWFLIPSLLQSSLQMQSLDVLKHRLFRCLWYCICTETVQVQHLLLLLLKLFGLQSNGQWLLYPSAFYLSTASSLCLLQPVVQDERAGPEVQDAFWINVLLQVCSSLILLTLVIGALLEAIF